ncbi:MAG: excinuclease ABC subunit C [Saprospiraceae bacterium]|nr:excinuclease ABC subunit C [Saprospiraceae bacterium]
MTYEEYKEILPSLPTDPGIYRFLDRHNQIIYVGKAKNLKNRIVSYFGDKKHQTAKTRTMVKVACKLEYTLVETEHDALLLEAMLIKQNQPRYNVMLKDGKTYVYVCIKNEPFARVFFTRKVIKDGSVYFGPYTSKYRTETILDLIKIIFPLRNCTLNLAQDQIQKKKYKVCLEYHIKNCLGPCAGLETQAQYNERLVQIKNILRGHFKPVKEFIHHEMKRLSELMEFEKAQEWKNKLSTMEDYQSKSTVVSTSISDVDVFTIALGEDVAFVNFIKVIDGAINQTLTIEAEKNLDDDPGIILSLAIDKIRAQCEYIAPEIVVSIPISIGEGNTIITIPQRGEKKKLLELSEKNAQYALLQHKRDLINKTKKQTPSERILNTLKSDLHMQHLPLHIECFDNSNIQGTHPVSACVVFKNSKPSKRDYRHFHVKTVEGPDDFSTMEEIVYRRYKRMLDENQDLPQLIIIDGGKGQLSSAMKSIDALELRSKITIIGIAKKLEEIYFPEDPVPLHINKKSESLKLIQHLRNEAHRFGITFHRNTRSKAMLQSELDHIPGIGPKTATKLLKHFGSVANLQKANFEEWEKIAGKGMANKLNQHFNDRFLN